MCGMPYNMLWLSVDERKWISLRGVTEDDPETWNRLFIKSNGRISVLSYTLLNSIHLTLWILEYMWPWNIRSFDKDYPPKISPLNPNLLFRTMESNKNKIHVSLVYVCETKEGFFGYFFGFLQFLF